jgi:hypothetical protein
MWGFPDVKFFRGIGYRIQVKKHRVLPRLFHLVTPSSKARVIPIMSNIMVKRITSRMSAWTSFRWSIANFGSCVFECTGFTQRTAIVPLHIWHTRSKDSCRVIILYFLCRNPGLRCQVKCNLLSLPNSSMPETIARFLCIGGLNSPRCEILISGAQDLVPMPFSWECLF